MMPNWAKYLFVVTLFLSLSACITTRAPVEEFNLAVAAIESAKQVEAAKHASGLYHRAQESLRRGQILYKNREYEKARIEFEAARSDAERSENAARLIRWKTGEVF